MILRGFYTGSSFPHHPCCHPDEPKPHLAKLPLRPGGAQEAQTGQTWCTFIYLMRSWFRPQQHQEGHDLKQTGMLLPIEKGQPLLRATWTSQSANRPGAAGATNFLKTSPKYIFLENLLIVKCWQLIQIIFPTPCEPDPAHRATPL